MHSSSRCALAIRFGVLLLLSTGFAVSQQPASRARIVQSVNDARRVTLSGNTHFLARAEFDQGAAPDTMPAERMMLLLSRAPEQQAALDQLLQQQQTPGTANYRRWLTPAEFGQTFGPADADVQTVTAWLQQQGFQVERIASARNIIEFSGSAGQIRTAFHTAMHQYRVAGKAHWANANDPEIPEALAPVVKGIVSLNNFPRKPLHRSLGLFARDAHSGAVTPQFTVTDGTSDYYALGPADFSTIYNTAPLLQAGNNGTGQVIAIVGLTNVHLQDVTDFRNLFGLGAGNTSVVLDGPDPGIVDSDETEALLDLEWANAVAPGATVKLVTAADTTTTSGLDLAAFHIIENNMAGVMSESYGACEAAFGTAGNQFYQAMWAQAAAQGITVVISAGDDGSAGCDDQNALYSAQSGLAVNGIASTPYNVAVGGTDFDDASNQALYWGTNNSTTRGSAKSYIPEMTWNESCAATATDGNLNGCPAMPARGTPPDGLNLWAGSGGASNCSTSVPITAGRSCARVGLRNPSGRAEPAFPTTGFATFPTFRFFPREVAPVPKAFTWCVMRMRCRPASHHAKLRATISTFCRWVERRPQRRVSRRSPPLPNRKQARASGTSTTCFTAWPRMLEPRAHRAAPRGQVAFSTT